MPKIVDHEERRAEIAERAVEAIAEHGLDRVKLQHVAGYTGCTTGALMHFFPTKEAVMQAALRLVVSRMDERARVAIDEGDLVAALSSTLPLDSPRRREWKVWLSYFGLSAFNAHLRRQNHASFERNRICVRDLLEAAVERGEVRESLDLGEVAEQIIPLIDGIGVWATLDPRAWPARRQKAQVAAYVRLLAK